MCLEPNVCLCPYNYHVEEGGCVINEAFKAIYSEMLGMFERRELFLACRYELHSGGKIKGGGDGSGNFGGGNNKGIDASRNSEGGKNKASFDVSRSFEDGKMKEGVDTVVDASRSEKNNGDDTRYDLNGGGKIKDGVDSSLSYGGKNKVGFDASKSNEGGNRMEAGGEKRLVGVDMGKWNMETYEVVR